MVLGNAEQAGENAAPVDLAPVSFPGLSQFEVHYFVQTRREIDTEKQERNKLLHYALLITGAIAVAITQLEISIGFLRSTAALGIYVPMFLLAWSIISARRAKLHQIFNRWITLYSMLQGQVLRSGWMPLEETVCNGIKTRRYLWEDYWLHLGLTAPIYGLVTMTMAPLISGSSLWWIAPVVITVSAHFYVTTRLLLRPFRLSGKETQVVATALTYRSKASSIE